MSLMRQTFSAPLARLLLAVALVCALLVTQFGLSRHVIEHSVSPGVTATAAVDDASHGPTDTSKCLTCLEHQAHGSALLGNFNIALMDTVHNPEQQALAPNTPYLAPERASQRAPPVLS